MRKEEEEEEGEFLFPDNPKLEVNTHTLFVVQWTLSLGGSRLRWFIKGRISNVRSRTYSSMVTWPENTASNLAIVRI